MNSESAEVVIIGGGIIGMAIAYYTSKLGMDVLVIERGEIAGGLHLNVMGIFWRLIRIQGSIVKCH